MKQLFLFVCTGLLFLSSCIDDSQLDIKAVSPRIEIGHFDHDFFGMDSINFDNHKCYCPLSINFIRTIYRDKILVSL